jgi:cytochrome P450
VQDIWIYLTDIPTTFLDLVAPPDSASWLQQVAYRDLQSLTDRRNQLLKQIIADRRDAKSLGVKRDVSGFGTADSGDMLNAMIEVGLSDNDILYVLVDMFVAGVNTVSSTTEWLLLLTAAHPEVQRRARLDALQGARTSRPCDYVEALVMEVMRQKQPLLLPRQATVDSQIGGYAVPKGSIIYANNYALTHSESLWRAPEEFRPERFLQEEAALLKSRRRSTSQAQVSIAQSFKFIPFSAGQRSCPGEALAEAELQALVSGLLRHLQWRPQTPWSRVDLRESYSLTLQPLASQSLQFTRLV